MCLIISKKDSPERPSLKVAEEDIVCYKILEKNKRSIFKVAYVSPIFNMNVRLYKKYDNGGPEQEVVYGDPIKSCGNAWCVGDGFFHLYKNKEEALKDVETYNGTNMLDSHSKYVCMLAIIPKGTEYIEGNGGLFFNGRNAIATKSVIYKKMK